MPTLDHVALNVVDLWKSIGFHVGLGFTSVNHWTFEGQAGADVIAPGTGARLELSEGRDNSAGDGRLAHIALAVDDIDECHGAVLAHGGTANQIGVTPSGARFFNGRDPDGTLIEFRTPSAR